MRQLWSLSYELLRSFLLVGPRSQAPQQWLSFYLRRGHQGKGIRNPFSSLSILRLGKCTPTASHTQQKKKNHAKWLRAVLAVNNFRGYKIVCLSGTFWGEISMWAVKMWYSDAILSSGIQCCDCPFWCYSAPKLARLEFSFLCGGEVMKLVENFLGGVGVAGCLVPLPPGVQVPQTHAFVRSGCKAQWHTKVGNCVYGHQNGESQHRMPLLNIASSHFHISHRNSTSECSGRAHEIIPAEIIHGKDWALPVPHRQYKRAISPRQRSMEQSRLKRMLKTSRRPSVGVSPSFCAESLPFGGDGTHWP